MYKIIGLIALLIIAACTEGKKGEQIIIPEAQLKAIKKAENLENEILKIQQKKQQEYKKQGL